MCDRFFHKIYLVSISRKYTWIQHLKDKKANAVLHGFAEIVNESNRNQNKL